MSKRVCMSALLIALACVCAIADDRADIAEGIRYHDLAEASPEGNVEKGLALLRPLAGKYPLAKGYYGSLLTLDAGRLEEENEVIKAMELLDEGTTLLDEAVAEGPETVDIRFLRMINSYELSNQSPLNRYPTMKADIDWLDSQRSRLNANEIALLELYRGLYLIKARRLNDAIAAFESCVAASPDSAEAESARKQLARYAE